MAEKTSPKTTALRPDWKNHLAGYLLSVLLIPLFGIGLIGLYWVWKRHHRISYRVSDTQISSLGSEYHRNIDLVNIRQVKIDQSWLQKKLSIGDLHLMTSASKMVLYGMENPHRLKGILDKAIAAEKERHQQQQKKPKAKKPDYRPGNMERINYLTGLWQQGLISDEDYEKERKQFE